MRLVRDPESVFRHMIGAGINRDKAEPYIFMLEHFEDYAMDFKKALSVVLEGLGILSRCQDKSDFYLLRKHLDNFSERVQSRIKEAKLFSLDKLREQMPQALSKDQQSSQSQGQRSNKKRKIEEAFPEDEINIPVDQITFVAPYQPRIFSTKKRRMMNGEEEKRVIQESDIEEGNRIKRIGFYVDELETMKQFVPRNESLIDEIDKKPWSWLSPLWVSQQPKEEDVVAGDEAAAGRKRYSHRLSMTDGRKKIVRNPSDLKKEFLVNLEQQPRRFFNKIVEVSAENFLISKDSDKIINDLSMFDIKNEESKVFELVQESFALGTPSFKRIDDTEMEAKQQMACKPSPFKGANTIQANSRLEKSNQLEVSFGREQRGPADQSSDMLNASDFFKTGAFVDQPSLAQGLNRSWDSDKNKYSVECSPEVHEDSKDSAEICQLEVTLNQDTLKPVLPAISEKEEPKNTDEEADEKKLQEIRSILLRQQRSDSLRPRRKASSKPANVKFSNEVKVQVTQQQELEGSDVQADLNLKAITSIVGLKEDKENDDGYCDIYNRRYSIHNYLKRNPHKRLPSIENEGERKTVSLEWGGKTWEFSEEPSIDEDGSLKPPEWLIEQHKDNVRKGRINTKEIRQIIRSKNYKATTKQLVD